MTIIELVRDPGAVVTGNDFIKVIAQNEAAGRTVIWPPIKLDPRPDGRQPWLIAFRDPRPAKAEAEFPTKPPSSGGIAF